MVDQCCIWVFASQTPGNIVFEVLLPLPFHKYGTCHVYMQLWPMLYLCICVFVFVYLHVRRLGTLFLRSLYHHLFKNIAHVRSMCNFDRSCICVFVYLCICTSDTWEHCFWGPYIITFQKIYGLYGPKPCTMEKSWDVTPVTDWLTDWHTHMWK